MNTSNRIVIRSAFAPLFERAADIEKWPSMLPHYRWVKILGRQNGRVTAEMAARHRGLPLWWKTIQIPLPQEKRIVFKHIGGVTKGMDVAWTFEEEAPSTWLVQIHHDFNPAWPAPGPWLAAHVIGEMFVKQVANKTLQRMKWLAEHDA